MGLPAVKHGQAPSALVILPLSASSAKEVMTAACALGHIAICLSIYGCNHLIISVINRGAVTASITPYWRRRRLCGDLKVPKKTSTVERLQIQRKPLADGVDGQIK